ncbi:ABC transporter ATP-binding protein [Paucisalibacillus sp. EB02]|uniref:ABC transporter ATP-binding protein n=1 Tax=Paucisalibacillus sp. EB02 TaxID=1347087 RepID=UPI0004AD21FC|nr:ABC transporter ATP-binding protein [Paucisalibacillus sp. EB02]
MIQVENLFYTYPGNMSPTIKNVNVSIKDGEIFGFLGPSGAGKSTIQKILIGVLKDYQGNVRVLNQDVSKASSQFYRQLGVAFETPNFYQKFTAKENLEFFAGFYNNNRLNVEELLEKVALKDAYNTRVSNFSKGMKMRLNIVRAFLHNPDLIFLDEPTSGLDPVNVKKVKQFLLEQKAKGKTIILNTHNMNVAETLCDRVAFVVEGEINLIDSPKKLKEAFSRNEIAVLYKEAGKENLEYFQMKLLGQNKQFQQILKGDELIKISTVEKTLEDIFVEVTGRELHDSKTN